MKILVTGGSGRIGASLVQELDQEGFDVTVFDLVETRRGKFVKGNLLDLSAVKDATRNFDAIIHLAAIPFDLPNDYKRLYDANVTGTFHILEAASQNHVQKVVFASSICTLGIGFWKGDPIELQYFPVDEKHPTKPQDLYGASKLIGEELCYMYTRRSGIKTICLRMASICFTNPDGGPTKEWLEEFERDIKPCLLDPKFCRDRPEMDWAWEYAAPEDVIQAFVLAMKDKNAKHEIYNIGAPDTPTNMDSLELAKTFYPKARIRDEKAFRMNKKKALFDISKAQKELGYRPRVDWPTMSLRLFPRR